MENNEKMQDNGIDTIKDILNTVSATDSPELGNVDFEFSGSESVVFEAETEVSEGTVFEFAAENNAEADEERESPSVEAPNLPTDDAVEFSVPDTVTFESDMSLAEDSGIWSTYLPRFTEASENYRMINDPRGNFKRKAVAVSSDEDTSVSDIDPTAELDGAVEAITVNLAAGGKADDDVKTVFKFGAAEVVESAMPRPRTVEDEINDINELMKKDEPITSHSEPEAEEGGEAEPSTPDASESLSTGIYANTISDYAIMNMEREKERERAAAREKERASLLPDKPANLLPKARMGEFSAPPQRDSIKDRFLDQILSLKVRAIVSAVFAVLLLLFENMSFFGVDIFSTLGIPHYTGVPALLDFEIAACVFILAIPEVIESVKKLVRGTVTPEISLIVSLVILLVYSITVFSVKPVEYALFGFLFAIQALSVIVSEYYRKVTDFESFKLVTAQGDKYALGITPTAELPEENLALDGAVDEYKSKTVTVKRTAFVSDFFKNASRSATSGTDVLTLMAISLGIAVVAGFVSFFLADGFVSMVTTLTLVFQLAMPTFSILTGKLLYHHASKSLSNDGVTVIGERALEEFSAADVIVYDDVEIFGEEDVSLRSFFGDMTKGMSAMAALFSAVGGPLAKMFLNSLDRKCAPAHDVTVEPDGVIGIVEGHRVLAGSEEFMQRHGATFLNDSVRAPISSVESVKTMYAAEDDTVYAHFRIRYSFSEAFTMILPTLRDEKTVPLIVTRDPNITNELVRTLTTGIDCIRVFKRFDTPSSSTPIERRTDSALIARDKDSAVGAVLASKKYAAFRARHAVTEISAVMVGAALGAALALGGMSGAPTFALGLWQLLWCVGFAFMSKREFSVPKDIADHQATDEEQA